MFQDLGNLSADWLQAGPTTILLIVITALMLFWTSLTRSRRRTGGLLSVLERLARSISGMMIFLGIVVLFSTLLDLNIREFNKHLQTLIRGGTVADQQRREWEMQWGSALIQKELAVSHYVSREVVVEIPGPEGKRLYRNKTVTEKIDQESIRDFNGVIEIHTVDPAFNRYILDARYEYAISNASDEETTAELFFPLSKSHLYENIRVKVDDRQLADNGQAGTSGLRWKLKMHPGQSNRISISYSVRGMRAYSYSIPEQRGIEDFRLRIATDTQAVDPNISPNVDALQALKSCPQGETGCSMEWSLDRVVMAPSLGITLRSQKPATTSLSNDLVRVVRQAPRALGLLSGLVVFSLLVLGVPVDLSRFTLYAGVFCAQFLALMGAGILAFDYLWTLAGLSVLALGLQTLILRHTPHKNLLFILYALFATGYPFSGLLPQGARNSFDGIVTSLILIYIFALVLFARLRTKPRSA